jgi:hypothetical protein
MRLDLATSAWRRLGKTAVTVEEDERSLPVRPPSGLSLGGYLQAGGGS